MPRSVTLNWTEFETAFERNAPGTESHLDLVTGEVLAVIDGQADATERRSRVSREPERYVRVEPASSREQYRWMERFVISVVDPALRERLLIAIDGKGAFRRFKDALVNYPGERERWFAYRADLLHYRMSCWLEQVQIVPANEPPWGVVVPPPEPVEALPRPLPGTGESPGEMLRRQVRDLIDQVPAAELPSAIAFLEFLRERGAISLLGLRAEAARDPELAEAEAAARVARAIDDDDSDDGPDEPGDVLPRRDDRAAP